MKTKKLPILTEKLDCQIKEVIIRDQKDIDDFNQCVGYRKARVKRYGKTATQRIRDRKDSVERTQ